MNQFFVTLAAAGAAMGLFAALATPVPSAAQRERQQKLQLPHYTITDLGTLNGTTESPDATTNRGWVESASTSAGDDQHAFLGRNGVTTDLGTLGVGPNSNPGISTDFGSSGTDRVADQARTSGSESSGEDFCFFGAHVTCLRFPGPNSAVTPLPTLGGYTGEAFGVNNRGQVVGAAENTTPDATCPAPRLEAKPVVWDKDDVQELPTFPGDPDGGASAINDHGQIVGASGDCLVTSASVRHALLWQHGTLTDLGNLGGTSGTFATDINNQTDVVGQSNLRGDTTAHAFLWTERDGMQDLGTLPGDVASQAIGINDEGQVVGLSIDADGNAAAFLWQDGVMTDLNTLIPADSPLFLFVASDFDSRGQIVGWGVETSTGETHAFLATPSNDEPVSGDGTLAAQGASNQKPKGVLPENVREQLRQGLGFRRFLGSPQTIALTNTAMISGPNATLSPTSLAFSTFGIGTTSAAKVVTLKNNGTASLSISSIVITGANAGDFAQTHTCGSSLASGASCSIRLTFKPTASGIRTAALGVTDNAAGSPQKTALSGTGTTAKLSPVSLGFSTRAIGTTSATKKITLTNVGTTPLVVTSIVITGPNAGDFAQTHTCGSSLAAGASCSISVTFKPTASGTRAAAVSVTDNAAGSPQKASLRGFGTTAKLSPTSLGFGNVIVGSTSPPQAVTLGNVGTTAFSISGITIAGPNAGDFAQTHTCGSSLAAGASCIISISFRPTATGTRLAALTVTDGAAGSPQSARLSGTGASSPSPYNHCLVSGGVLTGTCLKYLFGGICSTPQATAKCPPGQPAKNQKHFLYACRNAPSLVVDLSAGC